MPESSPKLDIYSQVTVWARRLGQHYIAILLASVILTVAAVWVASHLRFNSDLADLLPENHPDLRILRRIQQRYATDTGFMVLLSRNYVFATDDTGFVHMHDGHRWSQTPTDAPLYAAWGFAPDDVYVAGARGRVHHFDGKRWQAMTTPVREALRGLWGERPDRLYAVGDRGVILRFDGRQWIREPSATEHHLHAISGQGAEIVVVGAGGTILRNEGQGFRPDHAPAPLVDLHGVWAFGQGQAVAVGEKGTLLQRSAMGWRAIATGTQAALHGVWGSRPGNVQMAGDGGVILHFDGERVRPQTSNTTVDLAAVYGAKHDDVWTVGHECTVNRFDWEWFTGPFDTGAKPGQRRCNAQLTAVWRPQPNIERAKALAPLLAAELERLPDVSRVDYRRPVKFFEDRALLFTSVEDLHHVRDRIEENLERETAKGTGLYVDLEQESPRPPSKQDLQQLYQSYAKQAASFGVSEWFIHPDGTSLGLVVYPRQGVSNMANLRRIAGEVRRTVDGFRSKLGDPMLRIDVGGDAVDKLREYDATIDDIFGLSTWLAIGTIILLIVVYFRRLLGILFVAIPLGMSIAWTSAVTTIFIGTLNVVTGFLFAVLFGLGIDYGIQLYARYREGRSAGLSVDDSMNHVVLDTGRATLTSAITTAVALSTLMATDFRGFSEFGFIAGIGVMLALASFILVMPAMILLAERLNLLRIRVRRAKAQDERQAPGHEPFRLPRVVFVLSALALGYGIFGATRLQFEYDNRVLRPVRPQDEIRRRSRSTLGHSFTPTLLVANSQAELEAAVLAIKRNKQRRGEQSVVRNVVTILDLVPSRQYEKKALLEEIDELLHDSRWNLVSDKVKQQVKLERLRELARAKPFTLEELPAAARRSFKGPGYGSVWLAMVFHRVEIGHSKEARRLKAEVGNFDGAPWVHLGNLVPAGATVYAEENRGEIVCPEPKASCVDQLVRQLSQLKQQGQPVFAHVLPRGEAYRRQLAVEGGLRGDLLVISRPDFLLLPTRGAAVVEPSGTFHVSSGELVLTEVVEVLLRDGKLAFVLAFFAVFIATVLDFRSLRRAALAGLPLIVGMLWTFGLMHLTHIKLNMFNFVILPAMLGIGIDYGVHYVHRYHGEGPGNLGRVMRSLYWVIFFCAATTVAGFGNVAFAAHPGLRSLGQLSIISLSCIFFASTYTLPAVLYMLEQFGRAPAPAPAVQRPLDVEVYAASYCPSCRLVRRFLTDHGAAFSYLELDTLPARERQKLAAEIVAATGADALPVVKIAGRYVVGFKPQELLEALEQRRSQLGAG